MGLGDDLMVTGEAAAFQRHDPRPVCVVSHRGNPRWSPLWEGNPRITTELAGARTYLNGPGHRPYIDRDRSNRQRWAWARGWRATPGELYLTAEEHAAALRYPSGLLIVEPRIKPGASPNKDWGWENWQRLVELLRLSPDCPPIAQIGPEKGRLLKGADYYRTETFRTGCAVLARSCAAVLPEGGLHHAAAALGIPAVVIFGGYISPAITGYDSHVNLYTGNDRTLGWRIPHPDCRKAMLKITPEEVASHAIDIIARARAA